MCDSLSIRWIEKFLFGHSQLEAPPPSLYPLIHRLEAEHVSWQNVMRHGGFTSFSYNLHGDLDVLINYFEKTVIDKDKSLLPPTFRTRTVTYLYNQLSALLARSDSDDSHSIDDQKTLENILASKSGPYRYMSATFWGELARQWLSRRRPIPSTLVSCDIISKTDQLYSLTCETRGEALNPLSMYLIPSSEYVNASHWQSSALLEAFLKHRPSHPLSRSIQQMIQHAVHTILNGKRPSYLSCNGELDTFLSNIDVVHHSIPEASLFKAPPRVIDVFQRLLAFNQLDSLWKKSEHVLEESTPNTDVMRLTEQLLMAERQNKLLLRQIRED